MVSVFNLVACLFISWASFAESITAPIEKASDVQPAEQQKVCGPVREECAKELNIPAEKLLEPDSEVKMKITKCFFKKRGSLPPACEKEVDEKIAKLSWLQRRILFNLLL